MEHLKEDHENLPTIDNKDKVYLIRVPKGFDISKLNGVEFSPQQILQFQAEKSINNGITSVYELSALSGQNLDISVVSKSDNRVVAGKNVDMTLCVNKSISQTGRLESSFLGKSSCSVPMPEGLRQRFTPFGADTRPKKKKRKSKHKHSSRNSNPSDTIDLQPSLTPHEISEPDTDEKITHKSKKSKKKKKSSSRDRPESPELIILDDSESVQNNSKVSPHKSQTCDSHEGFNSSMSVLSDDRVFLDIGKSSEDISLQNGFSNLSGKVKKKKHKRKHSSGYLSGNDCSITERDNSEKTLTVTSDNRSIKKSKKKKVSI